jgi:hypothetical protein
VKCLRLARRERPERNRGARFGIQRAPSQVTSGPYVRVSTGGPAFGAAKGLWDAVRNLPTSRLDCPPTTAGFAARSCSNVWGTPMCACAMEPLTFSMRTSRTGRLLTLTALAALGISRSRGWRRWRALASAGTTADGLRTEGRSACFAGERGGAGRTRRGSRHFGGHPPPPCAVLSPVSLASAANPSSVPGQCARTAGRPARRTTLRRTAVTMIASSA